MDEVPMETDAATTLATSMSTISAPRPMYSLTPPPQYDMGEYDEYNMAGYDGGDTAEEAAMVEWIEFQRKLALEIQEELRREGQASPYVLDANLSLRNRRGANSTAARVRSPRAGGHSRDAPRLWLKRRLPKLPKGEGCLPSATNDLLRLRLPVAIEGMHVLVLPLAYFSTFIFIFFYLKKGAVWCAMDHTSCPPAARRHRESTQRVLCRHAQFCRGPRRTGRRPLDALCFMQLVNDCFVTSTGTIISRPHTRRSNFENRRGS